MNEIFYFGSFRKGFESVSKFLGKDGHVPKSRKKYWEMKLKMNTQRDKKNDNTLKSLGWGLIIVWECSCSSKVKLEREINRIISTLRKRMNTVY